MAIIRCPECGHHVSDLAKTCPGCGVEIAGNIMRCPDCGEIVLKNQDLCSNCHCLLQGEPPHEVAPAPVVAPLLATPDDAEPQPEPKKGHKGVWTALIVSLVLALTVVFLGLYFYQKLQKEQELHAYENALLSNEPAVLQDFLLMYVEAPVAHRDSVKSRLEILVKADNEWEAAVASRSKSALDQYVRQHPGNVHNTEAKLLIDSIDWQTAVAAATQDGYQKYMMEHGNGEHYDEAKDAYDRLEEERQARQQAPADSAAAQSLLDVGE